MFRAFDIFPKAIKSDLTVKTNVGGLLSIISLVYLLYNVYMEISEFRMVKSFDQLSVTKIELPREIPYLVDATVYRECNDVHFDITNQKRTFELDTHSKIRIEPENGFCRVIAEGTVPSVPGSMHIGAGKNYNNSEGVHSHLHVLLSNYNISHKIHKFQFGDLRLDSPLHGTQMINPKNEIYMIVYGIKLVPVISGSQVGFQILADVTKTNIGKIRDRGLLAIIFEWDFTPLQLTTVVGRTPLIYLISHILGIFGSFFVFVRWIDSIIFGTNSNKYVRL